MSREYSEADGVHLGAVTEKCWADIFHAINSPDIYLPLFRNRPVAWNEHVEWCKRIKPCELHYTIESYRFFGMVGLREIDWDSRHGMLYIYVIPQFQCDGIGTRAMALFLDECKRQRMRKISLEAATENERAIRLYKKNGFAEEGFFHDHRVVAGKLVDITRMAKFL